MRLRSRIVLLSISASLLLAVWICVEITQFLYAAAWANLLSGLLFLATIGSWTTFLLEVSTAWFSCSRDTKNRMRLLLVTTFILLIGVELVLRFGFGRYQSPQEQNGSSYVSLYQHYNTGSSWLHSFGGRREVSYDRSEFSHRRQVNSLGLAEKEVELEKKPNEYRVLAVGDSFTEGVGAPYESTWVKVLERRLAVRLPDRVVTTINAGISGSDPFFGFVLLRERLLPLHPDLVIVSVNPSDLIDVIVRGGMERFRSDGSTRYVRRAPKWEWAYASSYVFRTVIHDLLGYGWLLLGRSEMDSAEVKAVAELKSVLVAFQQLADVQGFNLLVVFHPSHFSEVASHRYGSRFDRLVEMKAKGSIHCIDLLEYYTNNKIMTEHNAQDFFWPLDGHHNRVGYEVMGEAIAQAVPIS